MRIRRLRWTRGGLLLMILLLLLTLVLRLPGLAERGIWQDEGLTLYQIRLPFLQIWQNKIPVAQFMTQNTVPPLYFVALGAWGRVLGFDLWMLRLFSVFCVVGAAALFYRAAAWMDRPRAGYFATLLAALSPLYLWYGQELRMYTFLLLPTTLSFVLLWRWHQQRLADRRSWGWAVAYAITAAAMVWSHYLAFLLLAAQLLWVLVTLGRRQIIALFLSLVLLLLLAWPLLPFGIERFLDGAERDFVFLPFSQIWFDLIHAFSFGLPFQINAPWEDLRLLFPLSYLLLLLGLWQAWRRGRWSLTLLLGGGFLLPILFLYVASYVKPLYQNARHLMVASPAFYLLWALGLNRLAEMRRWLAVLAIGLWSAGWMVSITHYYFDDVASQKANVEPLFRYLAEEYVPGDVVALNEPVLQHALEYIAPDIPWVILPDYAVPLSDESAFSRYAQVAGEYDRVWYVYGPSDSSFDTAQHVLNWFQDNHSRLRLIQFPGNVDIGAVHFDTHGPVVQYEPQPTAVPIEAAFTPEIRFRGLAESLDPSPTGHALVVESLWAADAQPSEKYQILLRLRDGSGQLWHQEQSEPLGGLHVTSHWQAGQYIRLPIFLHPPADLPPATYQLELLLVGEAGDTRGPMASEGPLQLGPLTLTRPTVAARVEGAQVGNALRVETASLPERLPPGAHLPLTLRVAIQQPDALPDRFEVALGVPGEAPAWRGGLPWADGLPTDEEGKPQPPPGGWQAGDVALLRYSLALSPTLEGEYTVTLSALRGEEVLPVRTWWGLRRLERMTLGQLTVEGRAPRTETPPVEQRLDANWDGVVTLLGYNPAPQSLPRTEPLHLQLVWQAETATDSPYKTFLHLLDETGTFITSADAFFDVPSTTWQADEILLSDHRVEGNTLAPGRYTLVAGLYNEETGARLRVDAPDFALLIGSVEITE